MCCGAPELVVAERHPPPSISWAPARRTTPGGRLHPCFGSVGVVMSGRIPSTTLLTEIEEFHRPGREYFWISFSRSGQSPEGVALFEQALDRHREIRHLVITCNPEGPMAQVCARNPDRAMALVLDDAVNDRGLAMTSSFSNMVLAGQCVGHLEDLAQFGEAVAQMSETGRQFLPAAAETAAAVTLLGCTRACFVGGGSSARGGGRMRPQGR